MSLQATIHKSSRSLNASVSPRAGGGGRVQDVTYNGESLVNAEGVAVIPEYPIVPVQDVKYNNVSVVNGQGVAVIPEYPTVPVQGVEVNNVSVVNDQGIAKINVGSSPEIKLLYWGNQSVNQIVCTDEITNYEYILYSSNSGKWFAGSPNLWYGDEAKYPYFGVGVDNNNYVWYYPQSDEKTFNKFIGNIAITLILGINGINIDCPWPIAP